MDKLINHLFNYMIGADIDDKDEYQQQEIYKLLARGYIVLYCSIWLVMVIALIWDIYWYGHLTLPTCAMGSVFILSNYVVVKKLDKNKMLRREFESMIEYKKALTKFRNKIIFASLYFGTIMTVIFLMFSNVGGRLSMKLAMVIIVIGILTGICYGVMMYLSCKKYFILIEEE